MPLKILCVLVPVLAFWCMCIVPECAIHNGTERCYFYNEVIVISMYELLTLLFSSGALMYLNEATLLNNIKIRYMKDAIYVSFNCKIVILINISKI